MSYDVEISTSIAVMQCLFSVGEKRRVRNQKLSLSLSLSLYIYIYIAVVTPESPSGGVTYRYGVAPGRRLRRHQNDIYIVFDSLLSSFHL